MQFRAKVFLSTIIVIALATITTLVFLGRKNENYKPGVYAEYDHAVNKATKLYQDKKQLGVNFSKGPCLTNDLAPDWVADIVHNPRTKEDDLKQNQCQAFLEGRAKHFVELDIDGNLVRIK